MQSYWVTAQAEYSTDVLFRSHQAREELMPRLLTYSTLYFEARDVLAFLGRKLSGHFLGEVVTDQLDFSQMPKRLSGRHVKHRMKRNWMKMYNKEGVGLRVETVSNDPEEFRLRWRVRRHGCSVMAWVPLRQSVAFLSRYQEICGQCNGRDLDALAHVDDPHARHPRARCPECAGRHSRRPYGAPVQPGGAPGAHAVRGADERRTCLARLDQPRAAREARAGRIPSRGRPCQAVRPRDPSVAPAPRPPVGREDSPLTPLAGLPEWAAVSWRQR